jgi:hypothetical protein
LPVFKVILPPSQNVVAALPLSMVLSAYPVACTLLAKNRNTEIEEISLNKNLFMLVVS